MPSIRVKANYRHLDDDVPLTTRPHTSWTTPSPPPRVPRRASKVSGHIMSTRRIPPISAARHPDTTLAGPSHNRPHLRPTLDTYTVEGTQAELRVPTEDDQGLEGSQINFALSHIGDRGPSDSLGEHNDDIVEHLDVIDPHISTVSTLTNAANAIVVPPLSFYSRKPVVILPRLNRREDVENVSEQGDVHEDALDQHVEDVLTKRDKFRRVMQGVWSFVKTPLGFVTAIYGFLVVFWGTGIVLFLAKFINLHNDITQGFWVEVCQQVETGLFTATSIGFIPFRVMDIYRICKIWRYKRKIARVRKLAGLPELYDPDDLPDPVYDPNYVQVLTEKEQIDLHYQQHQFMKSQTWYRPHGTQTHRAFPINLALWICICNDLNSFFQILLSGTMWGLNRFDRPAWTTGLTLPAAFVAGIIAGVLIYWGGRKTRRTEQVEDRLRMALAMERDPRRALPSTMEEASECPEGMLPANSTPTAEYSSMTESSLQLAAGQEAIVSRDAEKEMEPEVGTQVGEDRPMDGRQPSSRSLQFEEEMVVPMAENLHSGA